MLAFRRVHAGAEALVGCCLKPNLAFVSLPLDFRGPAGVIADSKA